jgi:DNA-binding FadR family transcriptional regulator
MALYLDYQRATIDDLHVVRMAVERGCVEIVAGQMNPDAASRLSGALAIDAATRDCDGARNLHIEIAELTGNPTLAVFVKVLRMLWPWSQSPGPGGAPGHGGPWPSHENIVAAMLAGDASLARHRMTRHLQAVVPTQPIRCPDPPTASRGIPFDHWIGPGPQAGDRGHGRASASTIGDR